MNGSLRKEMSVSSTFWRKPITLHITVNEYQVYNISSIKSEETWKRRLLCSSVYDFFPDEDQDDIEKCRLTIKDNFGCICFQEIYNRIDEHNRHWSLFYKIINNFDCFCQEKTSLSCKIFISEFRRYFTDQ